MSLICRHWNFKNSDYLLSINLCCGENYIVIGIYPKGSDIKTRDFDTNYLKLLRKSEKMRDDAGKTDILHEKLYEMFFKESKSHFETLCWAET